MRDQEEIYQQALDITAELFKLKIFDGLSRDEFAKMIFMRLIDLERSK